MPTNEKIKQIRTPKGGSKGSGKGGGGGGGNNDWDARPPYGGSGTFDPTAPTNYRPYGSPPTAMNTAPAGGSGGAGNNYWALMPEIQRAGLMGRGGGGGTEGLPPPHMMLVLFF